MMREVHWDIITWRFETADSEPRGFATIRRAVSQGMNRGTADYSCGERTERLQWRLLGDSVEVRLGQGKEWRFLDPALYAVLFSHGVRGERVYWALAPQSMASPRRFRLRAGANSDQIPVHIGEGNDDD